MYHACFCCPLYSQCLVGCLTTVHTQSILTEWMAWVDAARPEGLVSPETRCDVIGDGTFGRCSGCEGRTLMNAINGLRKETSEHSLAPLIIWGYSKKLAIYEPESSPSPGTEWVKNWGVYTQRNNIQPWEGMKSRHMLQQGGALQTRCCERRQSQKTAYYMIPCL